MAAIDANASVPVETLIERAGAAVARSALRLLGGAYGRRVVVIVGPGKNGADGRVAGLALQRRGAVVRFETAGERSSIPHCDLVIDAAYGTGFHGEYVSPVGIGQPVLAVDLVSGLDALTGEIAIPSEPAIATITFGCLKPGLLFAAGSEISGSIAIASLGLDTSSAGASLVETRDVAGWFRPRRHDAHKWNHAVWVVGGSEHMTGAPQLAARAALSSGAGYVRVGVPGRASALPSPIESVQMPLPEMGWHRSLEADCGRASALVVGPGLGRSGIVRDEVQAAAVSIDRPMVLDGDALWAVAPLARPLSSSPRVLTPHDGEYAVLMGAPPGACRMDAARQLASRFGATVVLKGPTTVIARADGAVRLVNSGDARLATAGTGDVLSGMIGALLATGVEPFDAASAAAHVHGLAAGQCDAVGMTAGQLVDQLGPVWSAIIRSGDAVRVGPT